MMQARPIEVPIPEGTPIENTHWSGTKIKAINAEQFYDGTIHIVHTNADGRFPSRCSLETWMSWHKRCHVGGNYARIAGE